MAGMVVKVTAIKSNRAAVNADPRTIEGLVARELGPVGFAGDMIRVMADYPTQMGTVSGYRRTGSLGQGWRMSLLRRRHGAILVEVTNKVIYAGRVQGRSKGPKGPGTQTREMRRRRWTPIDRGVRRTWPKHRTVIVRILTQRDPRVRTRRI